MRVAQGYHCQLHTEWEVFSDSMSSRHSNGDSGHNIMAKVANGRPVDAHFQVSVYRLVAFFMVPLPLVSFVVCVALSIVYQFEAATGTHCRVANYLPTISSAIGSFRPQLYIWRVCIALHVTPRIMNAIMLKNYYKCLDTLSYPRLYNSLVNISFIIHLGELMSLLLLTYISSTDNGDVHEYSFVAFMFFSLIYMLMTCILMKWGHAAQGMQPRVSKCFRWEVICFLGSFWSFMAALYFYFRHNAYCEPGVYTVFAALEYITVTTNICFHGAAAFIFGRKSRLYATFGDLKED